MGIVVPEKFYIGFQKRNRWEGEYNYNRDDVDTRTKESYILGFATYYEENKKFQKRKNTITSWSREYRRAKDKDPTITPRIIDNELTEGFYIPEEIRRCGSWSGGNVLWRIVDPRGFELEISSNNLARIMEHANILKGGIIEGKCKWGWDMKGGSKVVLLPEDSEPYQEALKHTEARKQKVTLKDIQMGDKIQLMDGTEGIYLGKHNMLFRRYGGTQATRDDISRRTEHVSEIKRRAAVLVGDDKLYLVAEPKVSYLLEEAKAPYSLDLSVQKINKILKNKVSKFDKKLLGPQGKLLYYTDRPVMAFKKKPKLEDIELVLLPLKETFSELVALKPKQGYDKSDPDGTIYTYSADSLILYSTELGWGGYYGELSKAQDSKALVHKGIFDPVKKIYGFDISKTSHSQNPSRYTVVLEEWKWLYPAVKFKGETYPLIFLPEKK